MLLSIIFIHFEHDLYAFTPLNLHFLLVYTAYTLNYHKIRHDFMVLALRMHDTCFYSTEIEKKIKIVGIVEHTVQ